MFSLNKPNQPSRLHINNDHRSPNQPSDNFNITLETPVEGVKSVVINRASIPLLGYNIPSYESIFYFKLGDKGAYDDSPLYSAPINVSRLFTTPIQMAKQFNKDIKTYLDNVYKTASSGAQLTAPFQITASFDPDPSSASYDANAPDTYKYRMTVSTSDGTNLYLVGWSEQWNSFNQRMGFTNYNATASASTFTADAPPKLTRTSCIYVRADICSDTLTNPLMNGGSAYRDIVCCIPCNNVVGDNVIHMQQSELGIIDNHLNNTIKTIAFQFLDDNFRPLELPANAICNLELVFNY
jgi:hypothetical protein